MICKYWDLIELDLSLNEATSFISGGYNDFLFYFNIWIYPQTTKFLFLKIFSLHILCWLWSLEPTITFLFLTITLLHILLILTEIDLIQIQSRLVSKGATPVHKVLRSGTVLNQKGTGKSWAQIRTNSFYPSFYIVYP